MILEKDNKKSHILAPTKVLIYDLKRNVHRKNSFLNTFYVPSISKIREVHKMERKKIFHYPHLLSRVVTLVSQLYHEEISKSDFDIFYKRLGDQIEHEQKLNK